MQVLDKSKVVFSILVRQSSLEREPLVLDWFEVGELQVQPSQRLVLTHVLVKHLNAGHIIKHYSRAANPDPVGSGPFSSDPDPNLTM